MAALTIEVYSDLNCPWCFIGVSRMETVIAGLARPDEVDFIHRPFVVDPSIPESGIDVLEIMQRRYGGPPPGLARGEEEARLSGVPFDHRRQPVVYSTLKAQVLVRHALGRGFQRAFVKALYHANFVEQGRIADTGWLTQFAAGHGFGADEVARLVEDPDEIAAVVRASDEARARGVRSVPHFVFNRTQAFPGCHREAVMAKAIADVMAGRVLTSA